mmetsp:Transcript_137441/g.263941  ORF Transcript_137441/g.263941 Transcript_137441/m.263941 type:complete len:273 (-) Transcript_137441:721-1539(-)
MTAASRSSNALAWLKTSIAPVRWSQLLSKACPASSDNRRLSWWPSFFSSADDAKRVALSSSPCCKLSLEADLLMLRARARFSSSSKSCCSQILNSSSRSTLASWCWTSVCTSGMSSVSFSTATDSSDAAGATCSASSVGAGASGSADCSCAGCSSSLPVSTLSALSSASASANSSRTSPSGSADSAGPASSSGSLVSASAFSSWTLPSTIVHDVQFSFVSFAPSSSDACLLSTSAASSDVSAFACRIVAAAGASSSLQLSLRSETQGGAGLV